MTDAANAASELEEKSKVIAHLTQPLDAARARLEIARAELARIVNESLPHQSVADDRAIASEALG